MKSKRNYKSIDNLKNKVMQLNLYHLMNQSVCIQGAGWIKINDLLTDDIINQVVYILGGQQHTKQKIKSVLKNQKFSAWYLDRIIYSFNRKRFEYVAGQDYPRELQEIRKDLVQRY